MPGPRGHQPGQGSVTLGWVGGRRWEPLDSEAVPGTSEGLTGRAALRIPPRHDELLCRDPAAPLGSRLPCHPCPCCPCPATPCPATLVPVPPCHSCPCHPLPAHPWPCRGCCKPPAPGCPVAALCPLRGCARAQQPLASAPGEVPAPRVLLHQCPGRRSSLAPYGTPRPPRATVPSAPSPSHIVGSGELAGPPHIPGAGQGWRGPPGARSEGSAGLEGESKAPVTPLPARGTGRTPAGAGEHAATCAPERATREKLPGRGGEKGEERGGVGGKGKKQHRKVLPSFALSVLRLLSLSRRILLQVVIARLAGIMRRLCPELIHVERVLDERNRWCEREPLRPPIFPPSSDNLVLFGHSLSDPCAGL